MHVLRRVCSWWLSTMKAEGQSALRSEISDAKPEDFYLCGPPGKPHRKDP